MMVTILTIATMAICITYYAAARNAVNVKQDSRSMMVVKIIAITTMAFIIGTVMPPAIVTWAVMQLTPAIIVPAIYAVVISMKTDERAIDIYLGGFTLIFAFVEAMLVTLRSKIMRMFHKAWA